MADTAYCATCRTSFVVDECPPYGVIHDVTTGEHYHPITRVRVEEVG